MNSDFPPTRLGELLRLHHGFAFRGEFFRDTGPGDVLVTPGNFEIGGGFRWHKPKYYCGPVDDRFVLAPGDLLITMTDLSKASDTLGSPARVPCTPGQRLLHNQRIGKVEVIDPERAVPEYLYWALRTESYRRQIVAGATGTTVKHTSPARLYDTVIPAPVVNEQSRIAAVLDALDDKIDSDRGLAALLEEMVAGLFRAAFVDFIGISELDSGPTGAIPTGWHAGTLADIAAVNRDSVSTGSSLPYIGLDAMPRGSTVLSDWLIDGAPTGQARAFEVGDVLFGKLRPYFHKVGVAPISGRCSTEILVVRPVDDAYHGLVLGHVASDAFIEHCVAVSRGTRMPRAEWEDASRFPIAVPPVSQARVFTEVVRTVYAHIRGLIHETRTLAAIRDELLPKLISGEIRVPPDGEPEALAVAA